MHEGSAVLLLLFFLFFVVIFQVFGAIPKSQTIGFPQEGAQNENVSGDFIFVWSKPGSHFAI